MQNNRRKKGVVAAVSVITALLLLLAVFGIYVGIYYHADERAQSALSPTLAYATVKDEGNQVTFIPVGKITCGFIFYPGAKVEYTAYSPLMLSLAEEGILCVVPKMPFNLAFFGKDKAGELKSQYPDVKTWYLGGHSLGGAMASLYLADHAEEYEGLILLASYSSADLSKTNLKVLSVYGSEDGVLNRNSYEKYRSNLPTDFTERVIEGGCHAYFGDYGAQSGDGVPSLTPEEQQAAAVKTIVEFIRPNVFG